MTQVHLVRAFIRTRTRGRRAPTWTDRYALIAGLALAVLSLGRLALVSVTSIARQAEPSRIGAGLALAGLGYAGFLALARAFGPVATSAADAAWLVLSPLPRRGVLGRPAAVLLLVALPGGAALGVALLAALGLPDDPAVRLITAVVLGVSAAAGGMATAVLAQSSQAWDAWLQGAIAGVLAAAVLAAVLGSGPGRHMLASVAGAPVSLGAALAASCAATAALLLRSAWGALERIPARALLASSTRAGHVAGASAALDPGILTWIAEDAHWRGRALRSRPWPAPLTRRAASGTAASPALALAWPDWRRLGRRPGRLSAVLASAALPALTAQAVGAASTAVLAAGALAAAVACTTGARRDGDDPSLARLFGIGLRPVLAARAVLPALLGGAWLTLALAGLGLAHGLPPGPWWLLGPAAAPALAAGALRMARRRPADHAMPVLDTPVGAMPTGPLLWAATGADLALLGCAPTLLALTGEPSGAHLAAQALCGAAALGGYLLRARR
ncbi:DUF6297 family protein [Actinomadura xylanilytica]|uniref:DUF6297 family protein n=1 Tax=Actinomadura xylanilytica TaxID=887459 RepID=UPI00255A9C84|nr:DUF6297 family protein [Actinomadura xylanilytica]MDL4777472.1 DUF6297 family protein [Actinomadura xylanilytica]